LSIPFKYFVCFIFILKTSIPANQRQWLDVLEETKKKKLARDKQKRETALRLTEQQAGKPPTPSHEEQGSIFQVSSFKFYFQPRHVICIRL